MNNTVNGTINFSGQIVTQTIGIEEGGIILPRPRSAGLTVSVNGSETQNGYVQLGAISEVQLENPGAQAQATRFDIRVAGISEQYSHALVFFEGGATVDAATGGLINMAEAGNVQIQLRDQQNNLVQAGSNAQLVSSAFFPVMNGGVYASFAANFCSTGRATPGNVASKVDYTLYLFELAA
ncbi:fimbrial protein [Serratia sp. (in: enterobacteria)]|uniref:fimbrial protein n=1 Tax=Serratia sp. (in: enterobacteria) TaxID=616 RepID=UPI0039890204